MIKKNCRSIKKLERIESNLVEKLQHTIDLEKMVENSLQSRKAREQEILNNCDLQSLKLLRDASRHDSEDVKEWYKPFISTSTTQLR